MGIWALGMTPSAASKRVAITNETQSRSRTTQRQLAADARGVHQEENCMMLCNAPESAGISASRPEISRSASACGGGKRLTQVSRSAMTRLKCRPLPYQTAAVHGAGHTRYSGGYPGLPTADEVCVRVHA